MKKLSLLLIGFLILNPFYAQEEISGIRPAKTITIGSETLNFNGAGIREKFFMDMYVGSLYLKNKSNDRKKIINANESMAITLDIVSSLITSKKMINAVNEGFENATNGDTEALKGKIETFKNHFNAAIQKGDHFLIAYEKGIGIVVTKNGKKMPPIKGFNFKKALFGIWFGEEPADESLMEGMLGLD